MILKCYPICECGHVFKDMVSHEKYEEVNENKSRWYRVYNPSHCPNCTKEIDKIELPKEGYSGMIDFRDKEENNGI